MSINSIEDIQRLVLSGVDNLSEYGAVYARTWNNLILFNYTAEAAYKDEWNYFETVSRGLILNAETGEVAARGFDKFFNWLQGGRKASGHLVGVREKLDGSLGITYRYNGELRVATRGSFDGDQAQWATRWLQAHKYYRGLLALPEDWTLLFEIIYPENRVVVDYGERRELVLLAIRNHRTGEYLPMFPDVYEVAARHELNTPKIHVFNDVGSIIAAAGQLDANHEGFVLEFSDGSLWKIKGDRYIELHRLISTLSFKNTLTAMQSGALTQWLEMIPDEFLSEVRTWVAEIQSILDNTLQLVEERFAQAPKSSRKDFALWVTEYQKPYAPYLFARLDNKPLEPIIYKGIANTTDKRVVRVLEDS